MCGWCKRRERTETCTSLAALDFRFAVHSSRTSANPNLNVLSVWFRFREALNLNQTKRTIQVGLGLGSEIFLN
jgi:hypothetical protein